MSMHTPFVTLRELRRFAGMLSSNFRKFKAMVLRASVAPASRFLLVHDIGLYDGGNSLFKRDHITS